MSSRFLIASGLAASLGLLPGVASGCTCFTPGPDALLDHALVIFHGKVERSDHRAGRVRFKVFSVYKGLVDGEFVEMTFEPANGVNCGIGFREGAQQLVYGYLDASISDKYQLSAGGGCSQGDLRNPEGYQPTMDAYRYAVQAATESIRRAPKSVSAWDALATIQEKHRDYLPLLKTLSELEALSPRSPDVKERRGRVFAELQQWDRSLREYQRAIDLAPERERAKRGKDQALMKLGRLGEMDPARLDYSNMELLKAGFAKRDLRKVRFDRARLVDADFSEARLAGVSFENATLEKVTFKGADLAAARFARAQASQMDFSQCNLSSANFEGVNFHTASFVDADLRGSRFKGVRSYATSFIRSVLSAADFSGAYLHLARFEDVELSNVDFSRATFDNATLRRARLVTAKMSGARLLKSDLSGSDLSGLDLSGLEMQGISFRDAILVNANLEGALLAGPPRGYRENERLHGPGRASDLRGANLSGARLKGADLRYALFDCKTQWPAAFDPSKEMLIPVVSDRCPGAPIQTGLLRKPWVLREKPGRIGGERAEAPGAELEGLDLSHADFAGAGFSGFRFWSTDLRKTSFRGADLRNADFQASDLRGADFTAAVLDGATFANVKADESTRWTHGFDVTKAGLPGQPVVVPAR